MALFQVPVPLLLTGQSSSYSCHLPCRTFLRSAFESSTSNLDCFSQRPITFGSISAAPLTTALRRTVFADRLQGRIVERLAVPEKEVDRFRCRVVTNNGVLINEPDRAAVIPH